MCGLAKHGQLLITNECYSSPRIGPLRSGGAGAAPLAGVVVVQGAVLKGIKGVHDVLRLETDPLTVRRAAVPRPVFAHAAAARPSALPRRASSFSFRRGGAAAAAAAAAAEGTGV